MGRDGEFGVLPSLEAREVGPWPAGERGHGHFPLGHTCPAWEGGPAASQLICLLGSLGQTFRLGTPLSHLSKYL